MQKNPLHLVLRVVFFDKANSISDDSWKYNIEKEGLITKRTCDFLARLTDDI